MNKLILNTGVQSFIEKNWNADIMSALLKSQQFDGISQKELAEQLESKKKSRDKLPSWFQSANIYYPNKLNIEQTSSELTAAYKSQLVTGKTLMDLTGGLGVDSYYFSKNISAVLHCEIDSKLSAIAAHNFKVFGQTNIKCIPENGLDFLHAYTEKLDWIYIDPSRRSDIKGKVFLLQDCLPNLPEHLPSIFKKSKNILIKTSPLLDISQGIKELNFVKEIHVIGVQNEVKELLFVLEYGFKNAIEVKTVNLFQNNEVRFEFRLKDEQNSSVDFGKPQTYLYEPNATILKSGGFKSVGSTFGLKKLQQHSHLYTSEVLVNFPGRKFKILEVLPYSKSALKSFANTKANVSTRNFPLGVVELRKKHKIKDGGNEYLFFTKNLDDNLILIVTKKCD